LGGFSLERFRNLPYRARHGKGRDRYRDPCHVDTAPQGPHKHPAAAIRRRL